MGVYAPGLQPFISVKSSQVAITVSIALLALCKPVMADMISCADVHYLMGESTNQFSKTRSEVESEFGGLKSTLELPGAQYCVIVEGTIKDTYRCTWKYPYRDEQAGVEFEKELLSILVFKRLNQAATWSADFTSIPSLNFTPLITFAR